VLNGFCFNIHCYLCLYVARFLLLATWLLTQRVNKNNNNNNNNNNSSIWCYGKCDKFATVRNWLHWCCLPNCAQPDRAKDAVPHCACLVFQLPVAAGRPADCWHDHGLQESKLSLRFRVCSAVCVCVCGDWDRDWTVRCSRHGRDNNLRNFQTGCVHLPILFSGRGVGLTWWGC
jgi:hypothetical protein